MTPSLQQQNPQHKPTALQVQEHRPTHHLYYYATMGYSAVATWCKAIDKGYYFQGWNGLTCKRVCHFIKPSEFHTMGHLDQWHQGICSTKAALATITHDPMETPPQLPLNDKTNMVFMAMVDVQGQLFTDQTGQFSITSFRGNNYMVIFYTVDVNHIKSYPIKSSYRTELLRAYNDVYAYLCLRGYCPQLHKLDIESSRDYTPPEIHQTNIAKRAICTWKNHFDAMRASAAKSYCLSNWCKDLEQTDITLNMMRPCTQNPNLSAHEALEGMFSFDATPMAPIGTECMVHVKPNRRHTWGYHSIKAWYFAPALNHYRCIKAVTDTGAVRLADT
ncbi:hypothetical protein ACHAW6_011040 [Cyclotella cf. meneghiniana]